MAAKALMLQEDRELFLTAMHQQTEEQMAETLATTLVAAGMLELPEPQPTRGQNRFASYVEYQRVKAFCHCRPCIRNMTASIALPAVPRRCFMSDMDNHLVFFDPDSMALAFAMGRELSGATTYGIQTKQARLRTSIWQGGEMTAPEWPGAMEFARERQEVFFVCAYCKFVAACWLPVADPVAMALQLIRGFSESDAERERARSVFNKIGALARRMGQGHAPAPVMRLDSAGKLTGLYAGSRPEGIDIMLRHLLGFTEAGGQLQRTSALDEAEMRRAMLISDVCAREERILRGDERALLEQPFNDKNLPRSHGVSLLPCFGREIRKYTADPTSIPDAAVASLKALFGRMATLYVLLHMTQFGQISALSERAAKLAKTEELLHQMALLFMFKFGKRLDERMPPISPVDAHADPACPGFAAAFDKDREARYFYKDTPTESVAITCLAQEDTLETLWSLHTAPGLRTVVCRLPSQDDAVLRHTQEALAFLGPRSKHRQLLTDKLEMACEQRKEQKCLLDGVAGAIGPGFLRRISVQVGQGGGSVGEALLESWERGDASRPDMLVFDCAVPDGALFNLPTALSIPDDAGMAPLQAAQKQVRTKRAELAELDRLKEELNGFQTSPIMSEELSRSIAAVVADFEAAARAVADQARQEEAGREAAGVHRAEEPSAVVAAAISRAWEDGPDEAADLCLRISEAFRRPGESLPECDQPSHKALVAAAERHRDDADAVFYLWDAGLRRADDSYKPMTKKELDEEGARVGIADADEQVLRHKLRLAWDRTVSGTARRLFGQPPAGSGYYLHAVVVREEHRRFRFVRDRSHSARGLPGQQEWLTVSTDGDTRPARTCHVFEKACTGCERNVWAMYLRADHSASEMPNDDAWMTDALHKLVHESNRAVVE